VGTVGKLRHGHGDDLMEYIRMAAQGRDKVLQYENLSEAVRSWEKLMLRFRTNEGVLEAEVRDHARSKGASYQEKFRVLQKEGFLLLESGRYRVTPKGYFVLNGILETLIA
jgi:coproporphyrinogen III oxidase-like Fe-S oxidoreductase